MTLAIADLRAREILDSRGRPTVQADVVLTDGTLGRASVPSGASTGRHEKLERRDGGTRYGGLGVLGAVAAVNGPLRDALVGEPVADLGKLDAILLRSDGTENRSNHGANALLAISLATLRAAAIQDGAPLYRFLAAATGSVISLPLPMVNLVSGGQHARNAMDAQDILVIPCGASTYSEGLEWICDVHRAMAAVLDRAQLLPSGVADEGGYGLAVPTERALELAVEAIERAGHEPGADVAIAMDIAATQLFDPAAGRYSVDGCSITAEELVTVAAGWIERHPVISIEDLLHEDDWDGWQLATRRLGEIQLVGDDLFTTNVERVRRGIAVGAGNAVLVKPNQIGTLSETAAVVRLAQDAGMRTVISARSGETEDDLLADLAVGLGGGQIKIGSVTRSERLSKYNRLLQIEEELGADDVLATPFAACDAVAGTGGRR